MCMCVICVYVYGGCIYVWCVYVVHICVYVCVGCVCVYIHYLRWPISGRALMFIECPKPQSLAGHLQLHATHRAGSEVSQCPSQYGRG